VGVISGAAAREIPAAAELGLDCFVTGEPEEDSPYLSAELGVTLIAAGHHATETVGVRAVGDRLSEVFGVTTSFLGFENPV
jgi:putative NIF3 family GTP cyclohydrolase 1 type 2